MVREIHLTNELSQLIRLSDFVNLSAEEFGVDEKLCMKLQLVLEEAVTNIIQYGYKGQKNKEILIRIKKYGNRIYIVIRDKGIPFDPTAKEKPDTSLPVEDRQIGGLGIHLIKELMTEVNYFREKDENVLMMTKELR